LDAEIHYNKQLSPKDKTLGNQNHIYKPNSATKGRDLAPGPSTRNQPMIDLQ